MKARGDVGELKLVLNGSFRSGTSMLWKIVKDSNPDMLCFYEPCHPSLSDLICEHPEGHVNDLHGYVLFDEYHHAFDMSEGVFNDALSQTKIYPDTYDQISERVSRFTCLDQACVLQSNRWHYFLEELHSEYDCALMHVLRNPFKVWDSIQRGIRQQGEFSYQIRRLLRNRSLGEFFGSDAIYQKSMKVHSLQPPLFLSSFERFIVGWILSNDIAVKAVLAHSGTVLTYESILSSGGDVLDALDLAGVRFDQHAFVRRQAVTFLDSTEYNKIASICTRFGMEDVMEDLLKSIGELQ